MIAKKLRAAVAALFVGTAVIAAGTILCSTPAEAAVRAAVGKPLQDAIAAANAGNYSTAVKKVNEAESVGGLTAEEQKIITQTRQFIEVKSGGAAGVSTGPGAQAKFDSDYRAGHYRDVIEDEALLRKFGALNATNLVVIAQAYYQLGDYKGCLRFATDHTSAGTAMLERASLCAYKTGDDDLMRQAAEALVQASPTPKNWSDLLGVADRAKQMSDPQKLDIYRLKYLTGATSRADDYMTLAQLLIAGRLPTEARTVIEKGQATKILVDVRAQKLLERAKSDQARDVASMGTQLADARKLPDGDELIRLGQDLTGMGKYPDAISAIDAGIAKRPHDIDMAYVSLAHAQYAAGQKPAAFASLKKANKTPNGKMIADLWELYMRQH